MIWAFDDLCFQLVSFGVFPDTFGGHFWGYRRAAAQKQKLKDHGAKHSPLSLEVMVALRAWIWGLKISYDFDNVLSNQIEFDCILKQFDTIAF